MHLFVDISSHGFGHLSLTAPVLNGLWRRHRQLRLTLRSGLPVDKLRQRIAAPFDWIDGRSDFGFVMQDAMNIDHGASAAAYVQAHADWHGRVAQEAQYLHRLGPDLVFSNVAYLPLAGAAQAAIPALAMCSLNWADLFDHYFGQEPWATPIHQQILAAYQSARCFVRPQPAMAMAAFPRQQEVGPIAALGQKQVLPLAAPRRVLLAMGGIAHRLPVEDWPDDPDICWLVPQDWQCRHPRALAFEALNLRFTDLLASVDAVLTKPGYGTFTEAVCNATPVLYQRRENWPEQDCLIAWLQQHGRGQELSDDALQTGQFKATLAALLVQAPPPLPVPTGAEQVVDIIEALLSAAGCG